MLRTVTKEVTFDMAHRLAKHKGKCKNLHGHTYKLQVSCMRDFNELTEGGMLVDFYDLKQALNKITDKYDHSTMLCKDDESNQLLIKVLTDMGMRLNVVDYDPTCENMVVDIMQQINDMLPEGVTVAKIRLYETPTSFAEVLD